MDSTQPTVSQVRSYVKAFDCLNIELFDGNLPQPMLLLTRNANVIGGHFLHNKWKDENGNLTSEIAINSNILYVADINQIMGVLIHEMIHFSQHIRGTQGRKAYHNRDFARQCHSVGLTPKSPNSESDTGQTITTTVDPGGKAHVAIANMPDDAVFPWLSSDCGSPDPNNPSDRPPTDNGNSGKRSKYTCPVCGLNAWAKPGVKIDCHPCDQVLIEMKK